MGNPMTPCDIISVYTKMNENFKGGINNVMLRNNDPVDSHYHQRCVDNRHWSWTHASVRGKPIRENGRFGCVVTPSYLISTRFFMSTIIVLQDLLELDFL